MEVQRKFVDEDKYLNLIATANISFILQTDVRKTSYYNNNNNNFSVVHFDKKFYLHNRSTCRSLQKLLFVFSFKDLSAIVALFWFNMYSVLLFK